MQKKLTLFLTLVFSLVVFGQSDCITAISTCGNSTISYTPTGSGNQEEVGGSCLAGGERYSVWYKITINTGGTLTFTITPNYTYDDYDWAVYGPNVSCTNKGSAIRCNYSGDEGSTGLNMTNTNLTSGAFGSRFCRYLDVLPGQTYYLIVSNFSQSASGFSLTWGGTATLVNPFDNTNQNSFVPPGVPGVNSSDPSEISICSNSQLFDFSTLTNGILNGNSGFFVTYHNSSNNALTGTSPLANNTTVNTNTTYYYSITNDPTTNSCRQIGSFKFVNKTPSITINGPSVICPAQTITLTSSQATNNVWSTGATTQSITVNAAGTYTLTYTNGICSSTATKVVTEATDPNLDIIGNLQFCEGLTTTLTAIANGTGNTYQWNTGASSPTITVTTEGTYTVVVTTAQNCTYQKSVTVSKESVVASNASLSQCLNNGVAQFDLTQAETLITQDPIATFTFYVNQADAIAGTTNSIPTPTNYSVTGNSIVYVRVQSGGCFKVVELNLAIAANPTATITASKTIICPNETVTLTSNFSTGNTWSTGETTQSITVNAAGTYTLSYTSANCVSIPASITITQENNPNLQITGNNFFCSGGSTTLTAQASGSNLSYQWSNGDTTPSTQINNAGNYSVTVTTQSGCTYTQNITITEQNIQANTTQLEACLINNVATFNLTTSQNLINNQPTAQFVYYANQADALAGNNNFIATPTQYITPTSTQIYVKVTVGTCSKVVPLDLVVKQTTTPSITATSPIICPGASVTLTSNYPTGNLWSTGEVTQSITVSTPGTYTVTTTIDNCISEAASIVINTPNNPNLQIIGNNFFCSGGYTTLTAQALGNNTSYLWSNGDASASTQINTAGNYSVTVTTENGCTFTQNITITEQNVQANTTQLEACLVNNVGTFNLTTNQNQINNQPTAQFVFYTNQADALAGNNNFITTPTQFITATSTQIFVLVTVGNCSTVVPMDLIVKQIAAPTITASSTTICPTTSVTLTSSYPTGNLWSTGEVTQSITVTTPGTYTVSTTIDNCISEISSITINAPNNPNLQIVGTTTICPSNSTTLTATANGSNNYIWSTGQTTPSISVNTPGAYSVSITTQEGCTYTENVVVNLYNDTTLTIQTPASITCAESNVQLNATQSIIPTGSTILWTTTNGQIISGNNSLTPTVSSAGLYTLTVTTPNGCKVTSNVTVTENKTPPVITVLATSIKICEGESVTLTASGGVTYNWSNGLPGTGNTQVVSPSTTTTYSVSAVGSNGCLSTIPVNITITVIPAIESSLVDYVEICKGETTTLNAGNNNTYTYLWSTGETTPTINVTTADTYTVTIDNGVCRKTFTTTIAYIRTPEIQEIQYNDNNLKIIAANFAQTPIEYSIDYGTTWQLSNIFYNVHKNITYQIRVRNQRTICESQAEFYTYNIPNTFTPNGDGINDQIDFSTITQNDSFKGEIVNRYGHTVFTITKQTHLWNGNYLGSPLPTDTYWYHLEWIDKISKKPIKLSGWILIKNRN